MQSISSTVSLHLALATSAYMKDSDLFPKQPQVESSPVDTVCSAPPLSHDSSAYEVSKSTSPPALCGSAQKYLSLVTIAAKGLMAVKEAAFVFCNSQPTGARELAEDITIVSVLSLGQFTPNMYISSPAQIP
nr:hypothetical protein CFP56_72648 [Quercus suber]